MAGRALVLGLSVRNFRNIKELIIQPAPGLNVIGGDNGHGKTSLIEALYVLGTTKSFRAGQLREVIQEGEERAEVSARLSTLGLHKEQRATLSPRGRSFLVDGKRPKRALDYALSAPVVVFHPGELSLVSGPGSLRRTLLDRIAIYVDPPGVEARLKFQKGARERQLLLERGGVRSRELDAFEQVIAEQGARLGRSRRVCAERLGEFVLPAFAGMAPAGLQVTLDYVPGGSDDPETCRNELLVRRSRDLQRGAMTFGPQRDELLLRVSGRPARSHASQGQQRLLTLALKVAELSCVREATGLEPLLLLDDVSSELDPERTESVFQFLRQTSSQVFVTTTRPELFAGVKMDPSERADFRMRNGELERL